MNKRVNENKNQAEKSIKQKKTKKKRGDCKKKKERFNTNKDKNEIFKMKKYTEKKCKNE